MQLSTCLLRAQLHRLAMKPVQQQQHQRLVVLINNPFMFNRVNNTEIKNRMNLRQTTRMKGTQTYGNDKDLRFQHVPEKRYKCCGQDCALLHQSLKGVGHLQAVSSMILLRWLFWFLWRLHKGCVQNQADPPSKSKGWCRCRFRCTDVMKDGMMLIQPSWFMPQVVAPHEYESLSEEADWKSKM